MRGFITSYKLNGIRQIWVAKGTKGIMKIKIGGSKNKLLKSLPHHITWYKIGNGVGHPMPDTILKDSLDLSSGTPFQRKVWRQIAKIPKGETRTYTWLAKMTGRPKAGRAAANACGANPIPLLIPCHRVIRSDGTIGGFSGPLSLKKLLLRREGIRFD